MRSCIKEKLQETRSTNEIQVFQKKKKKILE